MTSRFLSPLRLQLVEGDGEKWILDAPFIYSSDVLDRIVTVPEGFTTDLASVPRLPVVYLLTGATGNEAAVVHDFLYTTRPCSRKDADEVFYEAVLASGVPKWRAWIMWAGIRAGGSSHWASKA
jgi:hypothetical protein